MTKPERKPGQRWLFSNHHCSFVTEILFSDQEAKTFNAQVIQVIRGEGYGGWRVGVQHWAAIGIEEYTYLYGQDAPLGSGAFDKRLNEP